MKAESFFLGTRSFPTRCLRLVITVASLFLLLQFVSLYLSWPKQILLGCVSLLAALVLRRSSRSHVVTLGLTAISLAASLRYGWSPFQTIGLFFTDESS